MAVLLLWAPFVVLAQSNGDVETRVREYFVDVPVMANIAHCESKFRHFGASGALRGGMGGKMIGVFQIYGDIHAAYAKQRGTDIETLEGNLAYARHLYEREGTTPWNSSRTCWEGMPLASSAPVVVAKANPLDGAPAVVHEIIPPFTRNLSIGMEHEEVRALQKFLNGAGFALATSGDGSPGFETMKFGALTRAAVRKFQCEKSIVCEGDEGSTGYGYVGPKTRTALLATPQNLTMIQPLSVAATSSSVQFESAEISRLQAKIAELTAILASLQR